MDAARRRIDRPTLISEADLRRATSDLYYALFHKVCETLAGLLPQDPGSDLYYEAYVLVYRLPEHAHVAKQCMDPRIKRYDAAIQQFARQISGFKESRERADYDPLAKFQLSTVRTDITRVETALDAFDGAPPSERASFAAFVALKARAKS